jgi:hypothetical protein
MCPCVDLSLDEVLAQVCPVDGKSRTLFGCLAGAQQSAYGLAAQVRLSHSWFEGFVRLDSDLN